MACKPFPPLRTDRKWDGDDYYAVDRPVERLVMLKLDYGIPHGYEDTDALEQKRRVDIEFNALDWELYLLLMHLKNRIRFSDNARQEERDTLITMGTRAYLNVPFPYLIIRHAELLTKIKRRELAGLPDIPVVPTEAKERHKALIKRAVA